MVRLGGGGKLRPYKLLTAMVDHKLTSNFQGLSGGSSN